MAAILTLQRPGGGPDAMTLGSPPDPGRSPADPCRSPADPRRIPGAKVVTDAAPPRWHPLAGPLSLAPLAGPLFPVSGGSDRLQMGALPLPCHAAPQSHAPHPSSAMDLNLEQTAAAHHEGPARHLLVLAGAGTGKTRTIVGRVLHLIRRGVPAERILMLTFTRRAASEMRVRLGREVGGLADSIEAGTFHHFCLGVLRRIPRAFGLEDRTVIDRDDARALIQLLRGEILKKGEKRRFPQSDAVLGLISYASNSCLPLERYLERFSEYDEATVARIVEIARRYRQRKVERRYLDYDDILLSFVEGIEANPDLRERIASLFQHVLVDEMQDTNPLQWRILSALGARAQLFCVGDDAQSIYAFRGADFRNVHAFTDRMPNSATRKLEENYRSTQEILDLANWLLARSPLGYGRTLKAQRGLGHRPRLVDCSGRLDEAEWIAADLMERYQNGAPWRDHMVLIRTAWSAKALEASLIERQIPYTFIGGSSLLEAAHVKDLLALCRASLSPYDELAWVRYLTCWPGIGDVTAARVVAALLELPADADPGSTLEELLPGRADVLRGIELARTYRQKPARALALAAEHMDPVLSMRYDRWQGRASDLRLLAQLAERHRDLRQFVETYTMDPPTQAEVTPDEQDDAVILITVHSAKGTEAPVCYALGVQAGNYPHTRSLGSLDREEEERRVLYVALTRAQNELILTRSGDDASTRFHGATLGVAAGTPYFLEDLPVDLVEHTYVGEARRRGRASVLDELLDWE